eukprot:TRINITY_DN7310_c0_g1_i1.p1 TRINITY_DN7310_c0_g1~~TRINITY_DN7310_c0_g1_i1.p1  ORF type:complete len:359 (+),score=76.38 TRINITY_DN7310_c0_g1_i1:74-1150(+)
MDLGPTWGFQDETHKMGKYHLTFYDVGGGDSIRGIWASYFAEVHAAIYVVDAADPDRLGETKEAFHEAINDQRFKGKPILIFANKQDLPDARKPADIAKDINLDKVLDSEYHITMCTALVEEGQPFDDNIEKGVQWLVDRVHNNYKSLDERVQRDTELQRLEQERKQKEQAERVRKMKEERERLKALEEGDNQDAHQGAGASAPNTESPAKDPAAPAAAPAAARSAGSAGSSQKEQELTPLKHDQGGQAPARSPSPPGRTHDPLPPIGKTTPTPPPPLAMSPQNGAPNDDVTASTQVDVKPAAVAPLLVSEPPTPGSPGVSKNGEVFALPNSIPSTSPANAAHPTQNAVGKSTGEERL